MNEGYTNIPNDIVRSEELDVYEKALLNVLLSYSGCGNIFPSYNTLIKQTGMKRTKLASTIKMLQQKMYIKVIKDLSHNNNTYQIIKNELVRNANEVVHETACVVRNTDEGSSPNERGVVRQTASNIKSINIKSIKEEILLSGSQTNTDVLPLENLKKKKPEDKVDYQTILDCLNNATGKNFRLTDAFKRKVNARLSEKYCIDDFKKVISNMASEWRGTEMEKYLTPDTLFGSKFDNYLNRRASFNPVTTRKKLN